MSNDGKSLLDQLLELNKEIQDLEEKAKTEKRTRKPRKRRKLSRDHPDYEGEYPVLARHYHGHRMNDGIEVPEQEEPDENTLFVHCFFCHKTHPLKESIYVNLGTKGNHWCCRIVAKKYNLSEVKIHV